MVVLHITPLHGITSAEKAFFVKSLGRGLRCAPVAGRDIGAAIAHFQLAIDRRQLQLQPRHGHTQIARAHVGAVDEQGRWRGLRHTQARAHHNTLATFDLLRAVQAVPDRLRQRGPGVEEHLDLLEQAGAQHGVFFHGAGNVFKARGHVEVHGGRDFAQIAQRLGNACGGGLAFVDIDRAAVVQRQTNVLVATKGVVPRQPVHQHGRAFDHVGHGLCNLLLVGAPHAVGVDDGLGQLGRARGKQKFGDGVRPRGLHGRIGLGCGLRGQQIGHQRMRRRIRRTFAINHFAARRQHGPHGLVVACGIAGKDQARGQRIHHMAQLGVVGADQRVRGRGRAVRHTGIQTAHGQHGVV